MAMYDNGHAAEPTVTVRLTEAQAETLRRLLYDDLRKTAEAASKNALGAIDDDAHRPDVHVLYDRMSMMASVLDVIGWTRPGYDAPLAASLQRAPRGHDDDA